MKKKTGLLLILILAAILLGGGAIYYYFFKNEKITNPKLLEIQKRGKVVVGTDPTYPPMEYEENEQIVGYDVDVAREIASSLGVELEMKSVVWEEIFETLKRGDLDMIISSVTITSERAKEMSFSDPYFNAGQVIIVLEDNQAINRPEDLEGMRVGVQEETTSEIEAKRYTEASLVISYEDYISTPDDLRNGRIDAIVIDYPAAIGMIEDNSDLVIACDPFTQEFYGVAVNKFEQAFLDEINKVIRRLKSDGMLKEFEQKWF